jgi:hypothetical protein
MLLSVPALVELKSLDHLSFSYEVSIDAIRRAVVSGILWLGSIAEQISEGKRERHGGEERWARE